MSASPVPSPLLPLSVPLFTHISTLSGAWVERLSCSLPWVCRLWLELHLSPECLLQCLRPHCPLFQFTLRPHWTMRHFRHPHVHTCYLTSPARLYNPWKTVTELCAWSVSLVIASGNEGHLVKQKFGEAVMVPFPGAVLHWLPIKKPVLYHVAACMPHVCLHADSNGMTVLLFFPVLLLLLAAEFSNFLTLGVFLLHW